MAEPLDRAVDASMAAHTPDRLPPFEAVQARKKARDLRRGGAALAATALAMAGVAFVPTLLGGAGEAAPDTASEAQRTPPPSVEVGGLTFLRDTMQPFVLRPGLRPGDPTGVHVSVPETWVPDGECAVHYEPLAVAQSEDAVTIATWSYKPEQTTPDLGCDGVGHGDRAVRIPLDEPLGDRPLLIDGRDGESQVLLLAPGPAGGPVRADLAPADPDSAQVCLQGECVTVTDRELLRQAATAVNSALEVRPGADCSDRDRDHVDRTYRVRFADGGRTGPEIDVPLGCDALGVVGDDRRYAAESGGTTAVRIAYDQQISPETQCLGVSGPSGGPPTKDYAGLTLAEATARAAGTNNDSIRIAGRDGLCVGIVRDHVINRVNVYLEDGIVTASKSF